MDLSKSISVSSLSAFLSCPRKFFYSHEMRWKPIVEAEQLTFGKAWHGLMEYIGKNSGNYREKVAKYLDENGMYITSLNEDAFAMFMAMALEFESIADGLDSIAETEAPFSFRLPNSRWRVDGFIDAIKQDGTPVEYKTTSSDIAPDAFYWLRLKANMQAITYAIATEAEHLKYVVVRKPRSCRKQIPILDDNGLKIVTDIVTGERVYNANGKPRQTGGEGLKVETRAESQEELIERMREELRSTCSCAINTVHVTDEDKALCLATFASTCKQINELRKMAQKFSRPDIHYARNCTEFNCRGCPYQGICLDCNVNPLAGIPNGFIDVNPNK